MNYTGQQIEGAKKNAALHRYDSIDVTDQLAIELLDWSHSAETEYNSIEPGSYCRIDSVG